MSGKIINKRRNNYTVIPNEILKATDLSWKAKGLMCYLLSLSEEWDVYKKDLANRSKDGYESMLSAWRELEELGYIQTIRLKNANLFNGYEYIIHDSRVRGFTEPGITEPENPELISNSNNKYPIIDTKVSIDDFTFEDFWKLYPIKKGKSASEKKWKVLKKSDKKKIKDTLQIFISKKPFASYTHPYPLTYLNNKIWNDEYEQPQEAISETEKDYYSDFFKRPNPQT